MKKILITGASGQVGKSLREKINTEKYTGYFLSRNEFDLSDAQLMQRVLNSIRPDFICNAAAYTKVDLAEEDQAGAQQVNVNACKTLAGYCHSAGIPLLHYSSDYVYHNGMDRPISEEDPTTPQSVYAVTKLAGERAIIDSMNIYFIIRTSWVYDATGQNFVNTMLSLSKKYDQLTVVDDQIGSPTYAPDIADVTWRIIANYFDDTILKEQFGVYNFSNEGVCSWYDFAKAIFDLAHLPVLVKPVPSTAFPRPAARPHYSVLNKEKIRNFLSDYTLPHWRESLKTCLSAIETH